MKISKENDIRIYKRFTKCSLFLYEKNKEDLNILLFKSETDKFHEFTCDVLKRDNTAPFAIARYIAEQFKFIFTRKNLENLSKNTGNLDETLGFNDIEWYDIWEYETFYDWLEILTGDSIIQYDELTDHLIYLYEVDIKNLDTINEVLKRFKTGKEFKFFNYKELGMNREVDKNTLKIIKETFDLEKYVKDFEEKEKNGEFSYNVVISNKDTNDTKRDQQGIFHFPSLFQGIFKRSDEKWLFYCSGLMKFPSREILQKTKNIIIPGSHLSVNGSQEFLRETEKWIGYVSQNFPHIKFLGICFGEQQIIKSLGGKVDPLGEGIYILGVESITLSESFWNFDFVKKSQVSKRDSLTLFQCHGDQVIEHSDYFSNYGSAATCENQVIVSKDERFFLIQGHPEYTVDFNIVRTTSDYGKANRLDMTELESLKFKKYQGCEFLQDEQEEWRKLCFSFLNN